MKTKKEIEENLREVEAVIDGFDKRNVSNPAFNGYVAALKWVLYDEAWCANRAET